jgi:hypothetical protein
MNVLKLLLIIIEENKMKLRFDSYTKNAHKAADVFVKLADEGVTDLNLYSNDYNQDVFNLTGSIDANVVEYLSELLDENWKEDISEL